MRALITLALLASACDPQADVSPAGAGAKRGWLVTCYSGGRQVYVTEADSVYRGSDSIHIKLASGLRASVYGTCIAEQRQ